MKLTRAIRAGALAISCVAAGVALSAAARVNAQAPAQQNGAPASGMPQGGAAQHGGPGGPGGPPNPNQTAEQRFKNIQVLKGIPADQLIPSMQFIAASLGVDCEFCHVEHANDKDDKKPKLVARKMITMMQQINTENFKGEREVTCYSCHRGAAEPVSTPIISTSANTPPPAGSPGASKEGAVLSATSEPPSAQSILAKYLAAAGGADAIQAVKTRKQSGDMSVGDGIGSPEHKFPIEISSQGPDKRLSDAKMESGDSITAYNGTVGWLTTPGGVRPMNAQESQAASIDAQLYFPVRLPQLYRDFKVQPGDTIDGKATWLVLARGDGQPPLRLYFDQDSGLLVRLVRYTETALGRLPTQIDYADFRKDGGVTIPYRWTLARVNGRFTIEISLVKENLPLDDSLWVMPPPGLPGGARGDQPHPPAPH
jgi:photosynthetic reaction center cytochrome c subunit